jgi:hypothetical protein
MVKFAAFMFICWFVGWALGGLLELAILWTEMRDTEQKFAELDRQAAERKAAKLQEEAYMREFLARPICRKDGTLSK